MLGSLTEADDAVQDAWLRVSRAGADEVENLGGWLTTIVARVCLNMLRARNVRREESFGVHLPDPVISPEGELQPEDEALLADSVGLALLVVLDTLSPAERLAFVLHDMFELPFEEIAPMVGRSPDGGEAARQPGAAPREGRRDPALRTPISPVSESGRRLLPGSARGRLRRAGRPARPRRRAASRLRRPASRGVGGGPRRGGRRRAGDQVRPAGAQLHPALVNGAAGVVVTLAGRPFAVMGFTVVDGKIVEIDAIADPERVRRIATAVVS